MDDSLEVRLVKNDRPIITVHLPGVPHYPDIIRVGGVSYKVNFVWWNADTNEVFVSVEYADD